MDVQPNWGCTRNSYWLRTTENVLNWNHGQYAQVYEVPEALWQDVHIPEYVLAFEDYVDKDYNDIVAVVRVKSCSINLQRF